jgi:hypothetical protein
MISANQVEMTGQLGTAVWTRQLGGNRSSAGDRQPPSRQEPRQAVPVRQPAPREVYVKPVNPAEEDWQKQQALRRAEIEQRREQERLERLRQAEIERQRRQEQLQEREGQRQREQLINEGSRMIQQLFRK